MKTCGIDVATCTGMALIGQDGRGIKEDRGKTVHLPHERGFLRLQLIANEVTRTLEAWEPEWVAVEGYAYVKNVGSFVTLVEVGTVIRMALRQLGLSWVEVPPTVLKRWATGKGNAKKDQMAKAALNWGHASHSDDIVDAFCLAQMAQMGWHEILNVRGVQVGWQNPAHF